MDPLTLFAAFLAACGIKALRDARKTSTRADNERQRARCCALCALDGKEECDHLTP